MPEKPAAPSTDPAYERLVKAALAADAVLFEYLPEWYGDAEWPELDELRAALEPFAHAEADRGGDPSC